MQFCRCAAGSDFVDMDSVLLVVRIGVFQRRLHPQHIRKDLASLFQHRNRDRDRTQTSNLMLCRDRAARPRKGGSLPGVVDQAQRLSFGVAEVDHCTATPLLNGRMRDIQLVEAFDPPLERFTSTNTETGSTDTVVSMTLRRRIRPIEECEVAARGPFCIRVEQMVGTDVILVNGLFDQAHSEYLRVKMKVCRRISRNSGDVMNSEKIRFHKIQSSILS